MTRMRSAPRIVDRRCAITKLVRRARSEAIACWTSVRVSTDDVAIANDSDVKYEYVAGEIVARSGGTISHGRLIAQVASTLNGLLAGKPCIVLSSDMRLRIRATGRATYPDLQVICGKPELDA